MRIISLNIGRENLIQVGERGVQTGIYKTSVEGPVRITSLGLEGDVVADTRHHGGADQAVYIYGAGDYAWWQEELRRELAPGTFGENLTISELESAGFLVGDVLRMGGVVLQVSAPRIPCSVFGARMQDLGWVKRFRAAGRPGLYCRVLQEGSLEKGQQVSVEKCTGRSVSILEMFLFHYQKEKSREMIQRQLDAPIDLRSRRKLEELLRTLQAADQPGT